MITLKKRRIDSTRPTSLATMTYIRTRKGYKDENKGQAAMWEDIGLPSKN